MGIIFLVPELKHWYDGKISDKSELKKYFPWRTKKGHSMTNQLTYNLELPQNNENIYFRFYFSGWILPPYDINKVELFLNNNRIEDFTIRRTIRVDVRDEFQHISNAKDSGFEGIVTIGDMEGEFHFKVFYSTENNERILIGERIISNTKSIISAPPQFFTLGLTNQCNLSCTMCPKHSPKFTHKCHFHIMEKEISCKVLTELIRFSPSLRRISLQDFGEPFLYKDLFEVIEYLNKNLENCEIYLETNGLLLNEDLIERTLRLRVFAIIVSLDAASEDTYKKIRSNGSIQKVIGNLKTLITRRNARNSRSPLITTNFSMNRRNFTEIPQYIEICEKLGVDYIGLCHAFGLFESDKEDRILPLGEKENEYCEHYTQIKKSIELSKPYLIKKCKIPNVSPDDFLISCSISGNNSIHMDVDGNVFPCCILAAKSLEDKTCVRPMGNVREQTLLEIWDSSEFRKFREDMYGGKLPHIICKKCPAYYGAM